uniref:Guanine deaminase isoform X1 n=1 Tax=Rhizophora mucronata TaxID=61149 RepID=A0A2P2PZI2_RHIMU
MGPHLHIQHHGMLLLLPLLRTCGLYPEQLLDDQRMQMPQK